MGTLKPSQAVVWSKVKILMRSTGPDRLGILLRGISTQVPCQGRRSFGSDKLDFQLYVVPNKKVIKTSLLTQHSRSGLLRRARIHQHPMEDL